MTQGLIEGLAGGMQEVAYRHIIDIHAESQRIDEHSHGIGDLEI